MASSHRQPPPAETRVQGSQTRPRIIKACMQCRSKKCRCDGQIPACSSCLGKGLSCQYPQVLRRRGPSKGKQQAKSHASRLAELDSSLSTLAVPQPENLPTAEAPTAEAATAPAEQTHEQISQETPPSRKPVDLFQSIHDQESELRAKDHSGCFRGMVDMPILPEDREASLLRMCLVDVSAEFPIIDVHDWLMRVETPSTIDIKARGSAPAWASICAAMALVVHAKLDSSAFESLSMLSWSYFMNAYTVLPELILVGNDPQAVQALALMALFLRHSGDARTTSLLLSTAMRMSQNLRLSKRGITNAAQKEYALRALWATFVLDTEHCLFSGMSPALSSEDLDVDLPTTLALCDEETGTSNPDSVMEIFRQRASLALIQSAIRSQLYSQDSFGMTDAELLETIHDLDETLEDWRLELPGALQPDSIRSYVEPNCVFLQLSFHNAISMVHWAARRHSSWHLLSADGCIDSSLLQLQSSRLRVRTAAPKTLELLQQSPLSQFREFWRSLGFSLSAVMALLAHLLDSSGNPEANADVDVRIIKEFTSPVLASQDKADFDITNLVKACIWFRSLASDAIKPTAVTNPVIQVTSDLFNTCIHPIYMAHDLLSNINTCEVEVSRSLAKLMGLSLEGNGSYGPLVPECMKASTYGFSS